MSKFREKPVLFEIFPGLEGNVPWVKLGNFPTPLRRLKKLGKSIGAPALYIKRDDRSGALYGGNKIRKLEFSLAHALAQGKKTVVTFGGAGSNHVLATTIYGNTLGLKTAAFLTWQPPSTFVSRNIRGYSHYGTKMYYAKDAASLSAHLINFGRNMFRSGYLLPPGGSNAHGTLGYVDAAFEIKRQVEEKEIPEPERIYVAAGSGGTMAGLLAGARLAGLSSKIVGVRVSEKWLINQITVSALANAAVRLLRRADPSVPEAVFRTEDVILNHDYLGQGYGFFTSEGRRAMKLMEKREGIHIEGTYTAKCFAALLDDLKRKPKTPTLFINTYNSVDIYSSLPEHCDFAPVPEPMRKMVLED